MVKSLMEMGEGVTGYTQEANEFLVHKCMINEKPTYTSRNTRKTTSAWPSISLNQPVKHDTVGVLIKN